jgi:serine/threonine protein kinase
MALAVHHPPDDSLVAYGLGLLDDPAAADVARHLDGCPSCKRRVAELPADSFVGRMRDAVGPRADTSRPQESVADEEPRPTPAVIPPELTASHYADIRELGRGGMGVVYLARNTIMDRLEVLKVVNRSPDRFVREIQAAARLKHPNVVGAYSAQRLGGLLVFAMEYVPGEDLARLVKARGPLPVRHACNYVAQAALGLQHAHEHEMVHRDIKPSNLILARDGNKPVVKILDFGLAKAAGEKPDGALTANGVMLGTPDYVAPEQTLDAAKADIRSDIYSLGCTLYHLLAGRAPFSGRSMYEILQAHHSTEATALSAIRTEVPDELAAVVAKMMAKDPSQRYQTPAEVAASLTPFFKTGSRKAVAVTGKPVLGRLEPSSKGSTPARPPAMIPVPRSKRRRPLIGAAVAGLCATSLLIALAAGAFRVKTPDGTIVLEGLPADADVLVDDRKVTITRNGDEAVFTLARGGPYGLKVRVGDRDLRTSDAEVYIGGEPVRVRVENRSSEPVPIPPAGDSGPVAVPRPERKAPIPDRTARTNAAGRWRVNDDELIQSDAATDNCVLVFGDPNWTDYDFSFDVVKTDGEFGVAALFRARDPKNFMVFDLAGWQNRKYTVEVQAEGRFDHWVNKDRAGSMDRDRTYQVEVRARGDHFVCLIDGEVIYDVRDKHLARGRVGLRCWGGAVRVKSILVKDPNGTVLWRGPPDFSPAPDKPVGAAGPPAVVPIDPKVRASIFNRGEWTIAGAELAQTDWRSGDCQIAFGDPAWTDYDFTCEGKVIHGRGEIGQTFRVTEAGRYEWVRGRWTYDCDSLGSITKAAPPLERVRWRRSGKLEPDRWCKLEVRVRDRAIECFIDGEAIFKVEHAVHKDGLVGLRTFGTEARFRNLRVTDPIGKVRFDGLPELPPKKVDWILDS